MGYERYPRNTDPRQDYYNRRDPQDYGSDYGSGRSYSYSSARDYDAAGHADDDRGGYSGQRYGQRDRYEGGRDTYDQGRNDQYGQYGQYGRTDQYGQNNRGYRDDGRFGSFARGTFASGSNRDDNAGRYRGGYDDHRQDHGQGGYGRQPQGYDYNDRGFIARAGDEVRSWFGDEEAERRRDQDARNDQRDYGRESDDHYGAWRSGQIAALDRDYDEYRRENRTKFENEFTSWRTNRQGQRTSLEQVKEHMDVFGSDGEHVGTVDKVRGDRILLTKNDADAGGRHHSIPSSWLQSVDSKVTLRKTADEAKKEWRDEENRSALLNYGDKTRERDSNSDTNTDNDTNTGDRNLNRSFSGTY